jgi:hypothetical protein
MFVPFSHRDRHRHFEADQMLRLCIACEVAGDRGLSENSLRSTVSVRNPATVAIPLCLPFTPQTPSLPLRFPKPLFLVNLQE